MKRKKILMYGFLSLAVLIIAAFIFIGKYTGKLVDPYVRSLLEETKPMGHKIEYEKIRVNLFSGTIIIKNLEISPDTSLPENRIKMGISIDKIKLTDFSIRDFIFNKQLIIQDIIIAEPDVKITLPMETGDAILEVKERHTPKPKEQILKQIFLDKIILSNGNFNLFRGDTLLANSEDINFIAQSINLIKSSLDEPLGYTFGDVSLTISDIDLYPQFGFYDMKLRKFEASKKDSSIVLEELKMIPKYDKQEFSHKLSFQNDRFDLNINSIQISGIGLERWLAGEPLTISKVQIDSLDADIYRDKKVTANPEFYPLFYNELFMKIKLPLQVDTLDISNSRILYGELAEEREIAGTILLDNFNMQTYGLTNQVSEDPEINLMQVNIQAKVMGEGNMNIELTLPLEGDLNKFSCSGSVGAMQLSPLNDMLEPSINITLNGGKLDRMTFDFTANDNSSYGWMEFLFSDLDVGLQKKESEKQWGFISFFANAVAVSNNPVNDGKDIKIVEIGYERDKNKGIINYMWKTLQSGMVRTIIPTNKYTIKQEQNK